MTGGFSSSSPSTGKAMSTAQTNGHHATTNGTHHPRRQAEKRRQPPSGTNNDKAKRARVEARPGGGSSEVLRHQPIMLMFPSSTQCPEVEEYCNFMKHGFSSAWRSLPESIQLEVAGFLDEAWLWELKDFNPSKYERVYYAQREVMAKTEIQCLRVVRAFDAGRFQRIELLECISDRATRPSHTTSCGSLKHIRLKLKHDRLLRKYTNALHVNYPLLEYGRIRCGVFCHYMEVHVTQRGLAALDPDEEVHALQIHDMCMYNDSDSHLDLSDLPPLANVKSLGVMARSVSGVEGLAIKYRKLHKLHLQAEEVHGEVLPRAGLEILQSIPVPLVDAHHSDPEH